MKKHIGYVIPAVMAVLLSCPVSAAKTGWQGETGNSKFIREDSSYAKGIVVIDDTAYKFGSDGSPLGKYTGICSDSHGKKYYVKGKMLKNDWAEIKGNKYYFGSDGYAVTGAQVINGVGYSFNSKGKLVTAKDSAAYIVKADKKSICIGDNETINVTVSSDLLSDSAEISRKIELQKMTTDGWTKLSVNSLYDPVSMDNNKIGMVSEGSYVASVTFGFTPDKFSSKLTSGHYRLAVPVSSPSGKVYVYWEFDAIENAIVKTSKSSYDIRTTDKIEFTTQLNSDSYVYPQANELYIRKNNTWKLIEPKAGKELASESKLKPAGTVHKTYLDLTRYDKWTMETGTYRAYTGDGLYTDFMLTNPVDITIEQAPVNNDHNVKVTLTFRSRKYDEITVQDYGGELWYYSGKIWSEVPRRNEYPTKTKNVLKKGYVYTQDVLLTDFYNKRELKEGSYYMVVPTSTGEYVYAYFELKY